MRLVAYEKFRVSRHKVVKGWHVGLGIALVVCLLAANVIRPLPAARVVLSLPIVPAADTAQLSWPAIGQAAIAADNFDVLATHGDTTPIATASIAKVITALCVLEKYPLTGDSQGPTITLSKQDAALYGYQLQRNGSSMFVYDGEQITEHEALEAMLIQSANNIADSLATWAFGSLDSYSTYANEYVLRHGLVKTHIGVDASGLDPSTVSTATDLARLGLLAHAQPVIAAIASKTSDVLPNLGPVQNYNSLLGTHGITGLKTGNNDQNQGALLFTANIVVGTTPLTISGAVLGQTSLGNALLRSTELIDSIAPNFANYTYVHKGQRVGTAYTAWGQATPIVAESDCAILRWKSYKIQVQQTVHPTNGTTPGSIGAVGIKAGEAQSSATLALSSDARSPSFWWRLTRL